MGRNPRGKPSRGRVGTTTDQYGTALGYTPIEPAYSQVHELGDYAPAAEDPAPEEDSSYRGGYGGGGSPYDYTTDPVYQAYIASLDLDAAQRQVETARRSE